MLAKEELCVLLLLLYRSKTIRFRDLLKKKYLKPLLNIRPRV